MRKITEIQGPWGTAHVYRDVEWQAYVVRVGEAEYRTDDKADALATALAMVGAEQ